MRFEKWQALGNDYAIVEERELPFELTPERVRRSARRTRAWAPTASCCCARATSPASSPSCASSTPTAPRPSCPATACARRSCTCAATAGRTLDSFSVLTAAGEVRPRIDGPDTCTVDIGPRAPAARPRTSRAAPEDGAGTLTAADREFAFQFVQVGNPQCAIELGRRPRGARPRPATAPPIERHELFPRRTNVSFWRRTGDAAIRARIFERGVGETMSSGTGATRRGRRRRAARGRQPGDRRARRRRARGRGRGGSAREPDRLGAGPSTAER